MIPRKTPLRRKRPTARRWKSVRCIGIKGTANRVVCRKPQEHLGRCRKHLWEYLDGLWGSVIRTGRCDLGDFHREQGFACGGRVVACHGFDRTEKPTRWDLRNGWSGCDAANKTADDYRVRWYLWCRKTWGAELWDELSALVTLGAAGDWTPDYEAIERSLLAAIAAKQEAA